MWWVEGLGIVATVLIVISMCCSTSTFKGTFVLRLTNIIGSALFVVYGFYIHAYSTAILNIVLVFVNLYHTIKLIKENKKKEINSKDA